MGLYGELVKHGKSDMYPLHMPGHKRNPAWTMENPYSVDITEIDGFDNLHMPEGLIADIERRAALLFGASESIISVNGSTGGILASVMAACPKGGRMLIARNCHISVYHAAEIGEISLDYIYPEINELGFAKAVTAEDISRAFEEASSEEAFAEEALIEEALNDEPVTGSSKTGGPSIRRFFSDENENSGKIRAVVITSPTYEGMISDIPKIAEVVHSHGAALIVDGAHGPHLHFMPEFSQSNPFSGADVVIESLHKTLPALTQTAIIHRMSDRISSEQLRHYIDIFETSSPSYVLMSSAELCVSYIERAKSDFAVYGKRIAKLYDSAAGLKNICLYSTKEAMHDSGKLVLYDRSGKYTGKELYNILRDRFHLQPEMACIKYVLLMTSVADSMEGLSRIQDALEMLDKIIDVDNKTCLERTGLTAYPKNIKIFEHFEADSSNPKLYENCSISSATGKVSLDFVYAYPPGSPIIVPGEIISKEAVQLLEDCAGTGLTVNKSEIRVLRQNIG